MGSQGRDKPASPTSWQLREGWLGTWFWRGRDGRWVRREGINRRPLPPGDGERVGWVRGSGESESVDPVRREGRALNRTT
jgi:hypothetical protein